MFQRYQEGKVCPPGQHTGRVSILGQHFRLYRGTSWPPVPHFLAGCLRLHNNIRHQRSVLICHRDVMGVPLAVKIGVLATTSVGHVPITGGTTEPPISNHLPQGASRPHHLDPTCTFQGHFILWVPGSKFSGAGSRRLFSLPIWGLT